MQEFIRLEGSWQEEERRKQVLQRQLERERQYALNPGQTGCAPVVWPIFPGRRGIDNAPTLEWMPQCFLGGEIPDTVTRYPGINDWNRHLLLDQRVRPYPHIRSDWERRAQPVPGPGVRDGYDAPGSGAQPRGRGRGRGTKRGRGGRPARINGREHWNNHQDGDREREFQPNSGTVPSPTCFQGPSTRAGPWPITRECTGDAAVRAAPHYVQTLKQLATTVLKQDQEVPLTVADNAGLQSAAPDPVGKGPPSHKGVTESGAESKDPRMRQLLEHHSTPLDFSQTGEVGGVNLVIDLDKK